MGGDKEKSPSRRCRLPRAIAKARRSDSKERVSVSPPISSAHPTSGGFDHQHVRKFIANAFLQRFNSADNLYLFIANILPWSSESSPPTPTDTYQNIDYAPWRQIYALKKVGPSNISFGIPRYDWTTGTVYDRYEDNDASLFTKQYFVLTTDLNVYKCLSNNGGVNSTVMPTGTSTASFGTADGYVWKFMYSVSAPAAITFLTPSFVPVQTLASNDGSTQWAVQAAAVPGSIEVVDVVAAARVSRANSGTVVTASSSTVTLLTSATTGQLVGSVVYISSGTGSGQLRAITAWDGSTKIASISPNWSTTPDGTSSYVVGAKVTFAGDGSGVVAYGVVTANAVTSVPVIAKGSAYTYVTVTATANGGSAANLYADLPPRGGHGSDAVAELFGANIIISGQLNGTESGAISVGNDYRVLGVVADPLLAGGSPASGTVYDQTTKLALTSIVGTFTADELVTGQTSGATGYLVDYVTGIIRLVNVTGTFAGSENVVGGSSSRQRIGLACGDLPL